MKQRWSPIANLSHVMRHKPALMVFTACVLTIGITALFTALFISNENVILPNFDRRREWKTFLKDLGSKKFCLKEAKTFPQYGNDYSVSFPADFHADLAKIGNKTNIYGKIDTAGFHQFCMSDLPKSVNISFSFSKEKLLDNMVCVTIHNLPFLPNFVEPPCKPAGDLNGKFWEFYTTNTSDCENSLNFDHYSSNYEMMDVLTEDDKNSIYLGLTWVGTVSMCVTLVVFFYGLLYNSRITADCDSY